MSLPSSITDAQQKFKEGLDSLNAVVAGMGPMDGGVVYVKCLQPLLTCKTDDDLLQLQQQYSFSELQKLKDLANFLGGVDMSGGLLDSLAHVKKAEAQDPVNEPHNKLNQKQRDDIIAARNLVFDASLQYTRVLLRQDKPVNHDYLEAVDNVFMALKDAINLAYNPNSLNNLNTKIKNLADVMEVNASTAGRFLKQAGRVLLGALSCFVSALVFILGLTPPGLLATGIAYAASSQEKQAHGFLGAGFFGLSKQLWNYGVKNLTGNGGPGFFREEAAKQVTSLNNFATSVAAVQRQLKTPKPGMAK